MKCFLKKYVTFTGWRKRARGSEKNFSDLCNIADAHAYSEVKGKGEVRGLQDSLEEMLWRAADSERMPGWNDRLSRLVRETESRYASNALTDEMLDWVAAGVSPPKPPKNESEKK